MFTKEALEQVNKSLGTIEIEKGHKKTKYVMVNERVKAFREACPGGSIETEIIDQSDGVVTMRATICDDEGHLIATGMAQEKESSTFINKTSYIENCETSAVGRALGFAGIGIDGSMASAEEVANAIVNQREIEQQRIDLTKVKVLSARCKERGVDPVKLMQMYHVGAFGEINEKQFLEIANNWEEIVRKCS